MGASGWWYKVDYSVDQAAALVGLQRSVFESGDFLMPEGDLDDDDAVDTSAGSRVAPADPADFSRMLGELALQSDGEGTHSVLDMVEGYAKQRGMFVVSAITDDELVSAFGTTQPSDAQVSDWVKHDGYADLRDRDEGIVVASYLDGNPTHLWFAGISGD